MKNIGIVFLTVIFAVLVGAILYVQVDDNEKVFLNNLIKKEDVENSDSEVIIDEIKGKQEKDEVLNTDTEESNKDVENLKEGKELSDDCEKNGKVYFDIPELGISVLVNEEIKDDLVYTVSRSYGGDGVAISSKKLIEMDSGGSCSVDDMKGSGAFLVYLKF